MDPVKRTPRNTSPLRSAPKPRPTPEEDRADAERFLRSPEYQEYQDQRLREKEAKAPTTRSTMGEGRPRLFSAGGSVSASRRADGIARKGKTRGKMI